MDIGTWNSRVIIQYSIQNIHIIHHELIMLSTRSTAVCLHLPITGPLPDHLSIFCCRPSTLQTCPTGGRDASRRNGGLHGSGARRWNNDGPHRRFRPTVARFRPLLCILGETTEFFVLVRIRRRNVHFSERLSDGDGRNGGGRDRSCAWI